MQNETMTFLCYKSTAKSAQLFPIDYTQDELVKKLTGTKQSVKKNLLMHPYVSETLFDLLFPDTILNISPSLKDKMAQCDETVPPIPVEAEPFLNTFYRQLISEKYYKRASSTSSESPKYSSDFVQDFSCALYETIKEDTPANNYCRHVMFNDDSFSNSLLNSIWSNELNLRFDTLRTLARTRTPNTQASILSGLLQYIDQAIYLLANEPSQNIPVSDAETVIKGQLEQLLKHRTKAETSNIPVPYRLENLTVNESMNLKQAFHALTARTRSKNVHTPKSSEAADGDDLLNETRSAYLTALSEKIPVPEMETMYQSLNSYLESSPALAASFSTPAVIEQRCILATRRFVQERFLLTAEQMPEVENPVPTTHLGTLIESTILQLLTERLSNFRDTACLISTLFVTQDFFAKAKAVLGPEQFQDFVDRINKDVSDDKTIPYRVIGPLLPWLNAAWEFAFQEPLPHFNPQTLQFTDSAPASGKLFEAGQCAADYFHIVHPLPQSAKDIEFVFQILQCDLSSLTDYDALPEILNKCCEVSLMVFLMTLRKVVQDTVPELHKRIGKLIDTMSP